MDENNGLNFKDPSIRQIQEKDIEKIIDLFHLNYGDDYSLPEFYDEIWIKKNIYNDNIIWLVLEEDSKVIASGAIILDYGDYNDQIGEIGRLVVHPDYKGKGLGRRIVEAIIDAADDTVEFAFGEARTVHPISQILLESAGFSPIGYIPLTYISGDKRESYVLYGNLYGNARYLRTNEKPRLIPEIEELAVFSLKNMNLPYDVEIIKNCEPFDTTTNYPIRPLDRKSMIRLLTIKQGRLKEPYIYGCLSLDQGYSYIKRRFAKFLVAYDADDNPIGTIGYQEDKISNIINCIELIAETDELKGQLIYALVKKAMEELNAEIVTANISAYNPCLQKTFIEMGFFPVGYMPAMVFNEQSRYDVVKMLKTKITYKRGNIKLIENAKDVVEIVEKSYKVK